MDQGLKLGSQYNGCECSPLEGLEKRLKRPPLTIVLLSLLFAVSTRADDWPQWRGPTRDGVWTEQGVLKTFPPGGLKIRWRTAVGPGFSSPIVAQGRVFLTDVQLTRPMTKERVLCFEAGERQTALDLSYDAEYPDSGPDEPTQGPIPTPICHNGKVYTIGKTDLLCLDAAHGKLLWKKALDKEYQAQESLTYASPLIEGNLLDHLRRPIQRRRHGVRDRDRQGFREDRVACRDGLCGDEFADRRQRGRQTAAHRLVPAGRDFPRRGDGQSLLARGDAARESEFGGLHAGRAREPAADRRLDDEARPGKAGRHRALAGVEIAVPSQSQQHLDTHSSGRPCVFRPEVGAFGLPGGGHRQGTVANRQSDGAGQRSQHPSDHERGQDVSLHRPRGADSRELEWPRDTRRSAGCHFWSPRIRMTAESSPGLRRRIANRCIFARSDKELVCASLAE